MYSKQQTKKTTHKANGIVCRLVTETNLARYACTLYTWKKPEPYVFVIADIVWISAKNYQLP